MKFSIIALLPFVLSHGGGGGSCPFGYDKPGNKDDSYLSPDFDADEPTPIADNPSNGCPFKDKECPFKNGDCPYKNISTDKCPFKNSEGCPFANMADENGYNKHSHAGEGRSGWRCRSSCSCETQQARVGFSAPYFRTTAVLDSKFKNVSLESFKRNWLILLFYPLDFSFVCPTELSVFSTRLAEFNKLNAQVVAISVDSEYAHLAWTKLSRSEGGIGNINIPLLSDKEHVISKAYGVFDKGMAQRALFLIDDKSIIRHMSVTDSNVGRSVDETLRLLKAFQFSEKSGDLCPANWKEGEKGIQGNAENLKEWFESKDEL